MLVFALFRYMYIHVETRIEPFCDVIELVCDVLVLFSCLNCKKGNPFSGGVWNTKKAKCLIGKFFIEI